MQNLLTTYFVGFLLLVSGNTPSILAQSSDGTELLAGDFVKGISSEFPVVGDRWNLLRLSLENPHPREVELRVAIYFDHDSTLQYSRLVRIPPLTRVRDWLPVRVPNARQIVDRAFAYHVLVRSMGDATGLLPDETGALQLDRTLQVESADAATGMIHTPVPQRMLDTEPVIETTADPFEWMRTGRFAMSQRMNWRTLGSGFPSAGETGLSGLKQLVLANDDLLQNPAGISAVRQWLYGGGDLWVMLDQVDSRNLELLLGDRFRGQELERVELTSVQIVDDKGTEFPIQQHDAPVPMTRVLIDGVDVLFRVEEWPAAFRYDCGRGRLYVTTLGANAWVRPRTEFDRNSAAGEGWNTDWIPMRPYESFAGEFFNRQKKHVDVSPVFDAQMDGEIGFEIPNRKWIVSVLLGFSLLSMLLALVLFQIRRLALFGIAAPLLAFVAAGVLYGMRPDGREATSSAVISQLVLPIIGTDDLHIEGVMGIHSTESTPLSLTGERGGWIMPRMEEFGRGIRTLNYRDPNTWEWDNLPNNPGFRTAQFAWSGDFERVRAVATLDEDGLVGALDLPDSVRPEDLIVETTIGRIGVTLLDDNRFVAPANKTFGASQFLGANLLGDEQRRRSAILEQILSGPTRAWNAERPHLVFWSSPWETGFGQKEIEQQGTAVVAIPLELERPAAGTQITIPSPLLYFREVLGPDGTLPGGIFSYANREWIEKRSATGTWFGFSIPSELLPLSLDRVRLEIDVVGPVGQLGVWGWDGTQRVELKAWDNPVGTLSTTLDADSNLAIDREGRVLIYVSAGEDKNQEIRENSDLVSPWKIESLRFSIDATIPKD